MVNIYIPVCGLFLSVLIFIIYFSKKNVKTIETKLFSYLIFANLLGIADKVSEQFSKIYPKFNEEASFDIDMSTTIAINIANTSFRGYDRGVAAARARDYSGGSSWSGGGGSSFSSGGSSSGGSSGGGFR